jgi:hypothetical protein
MGFDITRKGLLPNISPQDAGHPVVRLPEVGVQPHSNNSHGSTNLIRSEDTDFGSDISRGAVNEGRLYNHKKADKPVGLKWRGQAKPDIRPAQDVPVTVPQRGVLRIQPGKIEQGKQPQQPQQPQQHRGGLLNINTGASKPSILKANKPRGNQHTEFTKNIVLLGKQKESQLPASPKSKPHEGPAYVLTSDDVLHEVKTAYQEIQTLERKIKSMYENSPDDDTPRNRRRPSTDAKTWSTYSKSHKEYSVFNHADIDSSNITTLSLL